MRVGVNERQGSRKLNVCGFGAHSIVLTFRCQFFDLVLVYPCGLKANLKFLFSHIHQV